MLNALLALVLAVTFVVTPPSASAGPGLEGATAVEILEDLDPELDTLAAAAAPVPAKPSRRFENVNASDPTIACAVPPPVPPPERRR